MKKKVQHEKWVSDNFQGNFAVEVTPIGDLVLVFEMDGTVEFRMCLKPDSDGLSQFPTSLQVGKGKLEVQCFDGCDYDDDGIVL